jgi:hypothetical protein
MSPSIADALTIHRVARSWAVPVALDVDIDDGVDLDSSVEGARTSLAGKEGM